MWPYFTQWRPLNEMFAEAQRLLAPWLRGRGPSWRGSSDFPPVTIASTDETLVVTAEVPGIDLKDLEVTITGDTLTIRGERRPDESIPEASYHRRERLMGHFARSVTLPERVDVDKVTAAYTNGVLRLTMPKAPEVRTRKIDVEVK